MRKGFFAMALFGEDIREVHEVAEVMDAAAGQQVAAFAGEVEPFDEVVKEALVHFLVVYEADGFAFSAILESFFDLLDEGRGHVVVEVDLGVAGDLEDPGVVGVITKIGKDVPEVEADDVLQQDDMVFIEGRAGEDHEPAEYAAWYFYEGIFSFHAAIAPGEHYAKVDGFVAEVGKGRNTLDHEGDGIGTDLL